MSKDLDSKHRRNSSFHRAPLSIEIGERAWSAWGEKCPHTISSMERRCQRSDALRSRPTSNIRPGDLFRRRDGGYRISSTPPTMAKRARARLINANGSRRLLTQAQNVGRHGSPSAITLGDCTMTSFWWLLAPNGLQKMYHKDQSPHVGARAVWDTGGGHGVPTGRPAGRTRQPSGRLFATTRCVHLQASRSPVPKFVRAIIQHALRARPLRPQAVNWAFFPGRAPKLLLRTPCVLCRHQRHRVRRPCRLEHPVGRRASPLAAWLSICISTLHQVHRRLSEGAAASPMQHGNYDFSDAAAHPRPLPEPLGAASAGAKPSNLATL